MSTTRKRKETNVLKVISSIVEKIKPPFEVESINLTRKLVFLRCPSHGIVPLKWEQDYAYACTLCEKEAKKVTKGGELALKLDDCRQKLAEKYGPRYQVLSIMTPYVYRKVRILCPKHGIVRVCIDELLDKGCPKCVEDEANDNHRLTFEHLHDLLHVKKMSMAEAAKVAGLSTKYLYVKCSKLGVYPPRRRRTKPGKEIKYADYPKNTG